AQELENDKQTVVRLRAEKAADDLKRYSERAAEIRKKIPPEGFIRALVEPLGHLPTTVVFHRGDHEQPKQRVGPSELTILNRNSVAIPENDGELPTTGRRLAYARHLTNGKHPLVARVIVNRIWSHHFGRGLVNSLGDFGFLGDRPTHPELLDWLADEFMQDGWNVKQLHRLMMLSTTYQQASLRTEQLDQVDPDNRFYGRMSIRRLESEAIRDSVLAVSGNLNRKMYGQPVPVMEDEVGQIVIGKENLDGERKPTAKIALHGEEFRRSIYVQARRSRVLAVLETFDAPAKTPNCSQRTSSNVAPQSLLMMNSRFAVEYAEQFARRVFAEAADSIQSQISRAWLLAYGVQPTSNEMAIAENYLKRQTLIFEQKSKTRDEASARHQALSTLCQALISANRFIYVD
ncbi:MAG: DUF1553 domain-containing protein, partial [Planctomycetes bacterium]|nr:DUF1553 domain-containing protein [Planctomycetota bacterium]